MPCIEQHIIICYFNVLLGKLTRLLRHRQSFFCSDNEVSLCYNTNK